MVQANFPGAGAVGGGGGGGFNPNNFPGGFSGILEHDKNVKDLDAKTRRLAVKEQADLDPIYFLHCPPGNIAVRIALDHQMAVYLQDIQVIRAQVRKRYTEMGRDKQWLMQMWMQHPRFNQ